MRRNFMVPGILCSFMLAAPAQAYIDTREPVMSAPRLLKILEKHPEVTQLDHVVDVLPDDFLMNFTLKRGLRIRGARGHELEDARHTKLSQSADPNAPRTIIFDERTGFSLSYNGGEPNQTFGQRLDMLSFDSSLKTFKLEQIDFPIRPRSAKTRTTDCASCHGPNHRPIFAMYPDWPQFYGADNDELTAPTAIQREELKYYRAFRAKEATRHPRYAPLYSNSRLKSRIGKDLYLTYPYRENVDTGIGATSRAFAFRPSLRVGILYNRLMTQHVVRRIHNHPRYEELGPWLTHNLLQCSWPANRAASMKKWVGKVQQALGRAPRMKTGGLAEYSDALAVFGLKPADVDMRYSYGHSGYAYDPKVAVRPMQIGYLPFPGATEARFFNSYFDGSATIDELMAARLMVLLGKERPTQGTPQSFEGLTEKYRRLLQVGPGSAGNARFRFDEVYFKQMDALGKWLPIPYPSQLGSIHHRDGVSPADVARHRNACASLQKVLQ